MEGERRNESRHATRRNGTYLKSVIMGDTTTFEECPTTMLNESVNGALLQMSRPFNRGDTIEVRWPQSGKQPTTTLFQVRWSQRAESHDDYVTGCRLLFSTEWINTFTPSATLGVLTV